MVADDAHWRPRGRHGGGETTLRPVVCCGAGGEQKERLLRCWCSLIPAGSRTRQLEKETWLGWWEVPSHSEGPTVTGTDTYLRHTAMERATMLCCPASSSGNLSRSEARLSSHNSLRISSHKDSLSVNKSHLGMNSRICGWWECGGLTHFGGGVEMWIGLWGASKGGCWGKTTVLFPEHQGPSMKDKVCKDSMPGHVCPWGQRHSLTRPHMPCNPASYPV